MFGHLWGRFASLVIFYVSPTLNAPHHGKVDLDGRPRDVGVYEGSTIIILKWGSTGEVSNSFLIPSQGAPSCRGGSGSLLAHVLI